MEEGDSVFIHKDKFNIYDAKFKKVDRKLSMSSFSDSVSDKGNFDHFMQKEIFEQPNIISNSLSRFLDPINKKISIPIERGMKDGRKITLEDLADHHPDCDEQGDLILIIRIKNHDTFTRKAEDLYYQKNILLSEALCGVRFLLSHLDGRQILIKYDEIVKPNQEYCIKDEGLYKDNFNKGNLIINFNIIFPEVLDNERKMYLSKILPINKDNDFSNHLGETKILENIGEKIDMEEVNLDEESSKHQRRGRRGGGGGEEGIECAQQ